MPKLILFFLILFLLFPPGPAHAWHFPQTESTADKDEPAGSYAWDFGQVKEGASLKHEFELKNDTGKALNIKDIDTSCSCTVSEVGKKKLEPGESTAINAKFNTKGYSGPTKQYIYVHTDSVDKPIIRFVIKADVIKK